MNGNEGFSRGSGIDRATPSTGSQPFVPPAISLPKGGGGIRGMGEKFAANPVTGTGSMSVPIATSPGRSGFGPQLALSYDSGAGNGPFGFGWNLSLPAITRKTDKGLPQYNDAAESDVFILSGAEDLVPVLNDDGTRWSDARSVEGVDYHIHRYRPRIEGLFARIERWTRQSDGDIHWRSISGNNILSLYGKDKNSRIAAPADPDDPDAPRRVFSWLICETRDDKGNAVLYEYKLEDGVDVDPGHAHERNRGKHDDPRRATNRYLKHIRYGNRQPLLDDEGQRPPFLTDTVVQDTDWMFEVVFDYGEHDADAPKPDDAGQWAFRDDPFSSYRAGFEVRTTRLCQRVLMFHHFPDEDEVGENCLVRSTDFTYSHEQDPDHARNPVYTFLQQVTQSGYKRDNGGYLKRSLPPVEFEYTRPVVQDVLEEVDAESLANLPIGLDGAVYQWTDLHGEGIPGILTEQGGAWIYKRNLSPINERVESGTTRVVAKFAPIELVATKPNLALSSGAQFMDLAGDGQPDLVVLDGPMPGLYEHDGNEGWQPFRPFTARLNRDTRDPNLKFVDLDGDGHADILITEDDAFVWHASLAEEGFGPARRVAQALDEEKGPRLVLADGTQSIHLADLSGDGLTDLVRIRNGEVCYWPNLGYGRFGAKVTMDHAPHFDNPDQFDHKRIRLADIDGTGTTDIIYLHRDGVRLYFNQSGNGWSEPQVLNLFPRMDDLVNIAPTDLLGNGTACLIWSSLLPGDAWRPMRYVNLMGGQKPHLLVRTVNNLGAETRVHYAPSIKFYLQDKRDGKPWITRLPFPVHVVEWVETYDHVSRNHFVTRYAYHHGYFDGEEREFRGFGRVDQWDTEQFGSLAPMGGEGWGEGVAINTDAASHVPPVHTKTWFHTGAYLDRQHISLQFEDEYYREPGLTDDEFRALLLPDTTLPDGLTLEEEREACRALKGMMLRQEVYADDAPPGSSEAMIQRAETPYTVVEQDFTIRTLQARAGNRHSVFFTHPREVITCHYDRNPADPRITHALTLEVDPYGDVLKEVAIGYSRRQEQSPLQDEDKQKQEQTLITFTQNNVTKPIDDTAAYPNDYRTPLAAETRTYELTGFKPENNAARFSFDEWERNAFALLASAVEIPYEQTADQTTKQKRLIEHVRALYRKDSLTGLLPLGELEPLALPGDSYKLAFTPGLLAHVFKRKLAGQPDEDLLPNPAPLLEGKGADQGGYVAIDGNWWIPSGRVFYSDPPGHTAAEELAEAQSHFFLPRRYRDPFGYETTVRYDGPADPLKPRYDVLVTRTHDELDNTVTAANDYRVLQPWLMTDPNGNRTQVAFDTLGMVAGTAVMGKPLPAPVEGDSLDDFEADLTQARIDEFYDVADPHVPAPELLQGATTRIVYDLDRYRRTRQAHPEDPAEWLPVYAATLARETHFHDPGGAQTKIQIGFSYSDGFGREIQKKIQAEPGPLVEGGPVVSPRWVGSGWTVFNNKGQPVRQYEPFFSQLPEKRHRFEFGVEFGVSPILFYDPVGRVIATLHPNRTYEKVVFDPWRQTTHDVNDTVTPNGTETGDPRTDADIKGYVAEYFKTQPATWQTWHQERIIGAKGAQDKSAAEKAAQHANTPTTAHFDTLGRIFLTLADNGPDPAQPGQHRLFATRVELDIEGNQRVVVDAKDRVVMHYDYDLLGNVIHQASMEAGARWMLNDVAGEPIRAWDSRRFLRRLSYDELRRPTELFVTENGAERLAERTVYGEGQGDGKNHRTRVYQIFDGAGVVTSEAYDFKGNLLESKRELLSDYKQTVDWQLNPVANDGTFTSRTTYDALNRPLSVTAPDGSVYRPGFNEANLLDKVEVNLRGAATATPFVTNIDYNAKGQRTLIRYDNGTQTTYDYDPLTFRLIHLKSTRPAGLNGLAPIFASPTVLQDLHYTYDPAGNITHIHDGALKTIIHNQQTVEPVCSYTYDALYRLIEAKGREHIGQTALDVNPPQGNRRDYPFVGYQANPNDLQALRNYTEQYEYDAVGNFDVWRHIATGGGWTRSYDYEEASLIESGKKSNRLTRTRLGNGFNHTETYSYTDALGNDVHGCMTAINSMKMVWDFADQLQQVNLGGGGTAYYVYDASGQRVRKVIHRQNGTRQEERIYLGGYEIYREYNGNGQTVTLARETLHVMGDKQRIALVETKTEPAVGQPLIRYQLGNHLHSASVELDKDGALISYEEYHPYGTTSFQAMGAAEVSLKRYRYTGKEQDEESGFYYHGARYYMHWLARWMACDPGGFADGINLYAMVSANPISLTDPSGLAGIDPTEEARKDATGPDYNEQWFVNGAFSRIRDASTDEISVNGQTKRERDSRAAELAKAQARLDAQKQSKQASADVPGNNDSVVFSNPLGETKYGEGRGATGHGLATNPETSDWESKAAQDMHAPVGSSVRAATDGTILWVHRDKRDSHTGLKFGDQVTIVSSNGVLQTFYTHIDADAELKPGATVRRGQVIGWVTTWEDNPKGTHLHFGAASRRADGTYRGIDPVPLLNQTKGSTGAHDVSLSDDGAYTVAGRDENPPIPRVPSVQLNRPSISRPSNSRSAPRLVPSLEFILKSLTKPPELENL